MTYVKNTWVDQSVERPKTYEMTNNSDGSITLIDSFGLVSEIGTPVNADNMNHIEEGIANNDQRIAVLEGEGERANTSLSNLNDTGEAHFANPSLSNLNSTGNAHFANPSLSNLNDAGNAKLNQYFKTTGGTVTGNITILQPNLSQFVAKLSNMSYNSIPAENAGVGGVYIVDKDGEWMAMFKLEKYTDGKNQAVMQVRGKDGSSGRVELAISADGKQWFNFPKCTTRATTTSSASNANVAVIVQNYNNGTSWYRVWSDGWIEQGGSIGEVVDHTSKTITFIKKYLNTNYTIVYSKGGWNDGFTRSDQGITAITATSFTLGLTPGSSTLGRWYACGY